MGALLWGVGVTLAGYYLSQTIPDIDRYFLVVVGAVILVWRCRPRFTWRRNMARPSVAWPRNAWGSAGTGASWRLCPSKLSPMPLRPMTCVLTMRDNGRRHVK